MVILGDLDRFEKISIHEIALTPSKLGVRGCGRDMLWVLLLRQSTHSAEVVPLD